MIFRGDVRGLFDPRSKRLRGYGATLVPSPTLRALSVPALTQVFAPAPVAAAPAAPVPAAAFAPSSLLERLGVTGAAPATLVVPSEPKMTLVGAKVKAPVVSQPAVQPLTLDEKARALEALGFKLRTTPVSAPHEPSVSLALQTLGFRGNFAPATLEAMLRAGDSRLPTLARDVAQWQLDGWRNNISVDPSGNYPYPEWLGTLVPPPPPPVKQLTFEDMWRPLETIGFNLREGTSYKRPDEALVKSIVDQISEELDLQWPATMQKIAALDPKVYEACAVLRKKIERDIISQQAGAQKQTEMQNAKIADIDAKIAGAQSLTYIPGMAAVAQKQISDLQSQRNGLIAMMPTMPQFPTWFGDAGLRAPPTPQPMYQPDYVSPGVVPVNPGGVTDTGTTVPSTALPNGLVVNKTFLNTYWPLLALGAGALTLLTVVVARRD